MVRRAGRLDAVRTHGAVAVGRVASLASRRFGGGDGTAIGGLVTSRLQPNALERLAAGRTVALVTGTNGKSTTAQLLATALATAGPVAHNQQGSNMTPGVIHALAVQRRARVAVLEVDEAILTDTAGRTSAGMLLMLNLTREYTRGVLIRRLVEEWRSASAAAPEAIVVADADDPLVVAGASEAAARGRVVWVAAGAAWRTDSRICPVCYDLLAWTDGGYWACRACDLRRPTPDWVIDGDVVRGPSGSAPLDLRLRGRWVRGNALFAIAGAATLGVPVATAANAIATTVDVDGRYAPHDVDGREVRLYMVKNPAGWVEALTIAEDGAPLVFAMEAFGIKDMVPPWDAPLETLRGHEHVAIGGLRRRDLSVLLDLHGVEHRLADTPFEAIALMPPGPVNVIANYSAFQAMKHAMRSDHR
jgi:UDP-N-acetylmuramyl tripeptide synthase